MRTDASQKADVSDKHPEVVERMMASYDQWWNDMTPNFDHVSHYVVGSTAEPEVHLDCHGWRTESDVYSYDQRHVREGIAVNDAFWPIEVAEDGLYRIELRRWPREVDVALSGTVPAFSMEFCDTLPVGRSYPISKARIEIQGQKASMKLGSNDKEAVFTLPLKKGKTELRAFFDVENAPSINAYYVFVKLVGLEK